MKKLFPIIFVLLYVSVSFGQSYEYGKPEELKGLTKVSIDTGTDIQSRNWMVKEFEKAKLKLEIVDVEDAQIYIIFISSKVEGSTTATTNPNGLGGANTTIDNQTLRRGNAGIFIAGKSKDKLRILLNYDFVQKSLLLDKPAEKVAKNFIKEYKKANGIK